MARRSNASQARTDAAGIAAAIATNFEGDATLHGAFAAACAQQFPIDIARGDAACVGGDLAQLGRLAHDLKSALVLLGHARASELAAQAEAFAQSENPAAARGAWQALKQALPPQG